MTKYLTPHNTNRGYWCCRNALLNNTSTPSDHVSVDCNYVTLCGQRCWKNTRDRLVKSSFIFLIVYRLRSYMGPSLRQVPDVLERLLAFILTWLLIITGFYKMWPFLLPQTRFLQGWVLLPESIYLSFIILWAGVDFMNFKNPCFMFLFFCFIPFVLWQKQKHLQNQTYQLSVINGLYVNGLTWGGF